LEGIKIGRNEGIDAGNQDTNPEGKVCQFKFGCFTKDLDVTVHTLQCEKVTDAAMESTSIYPDPFKTSSIYKSTLRTV
jgi:hypothetical protein